MLINNVLKKYDAHIAGYYGMQNSGDDALMYASVWGAKHLLQAKTTSVGLYGSSNKALSVNKQFPLFFSQPFPGRNRLTHYQAAIQSNSLIFGGGSVLHSESDINLKRHMMALAGAKNSRAVGVSLGPFQSVAAEKSCTQFLNECGFVGVRDQQSLEIARSLAPQACVEKTFDLAPLLLYAQKTPPSTNKRSGIALSLCSVAINPIGHVNEEAEKHRVNEFCHLIEALYQSTGETITLLTFNGHPVLGDWKINQEIMTRLGDKLPLIVKHYNPNPLSVLNDLANYKTIISMRLHGSILGYLANTPVISINYHEKCQGWCQQIGLSSNYQFNLPCLDVDAIKHQIEQGLSYGFTAPTLAVSSALDNALSNWSISHEQAKFYSHYSAI